MQKCRATLANCSDKERCCSILPRCIYPTVYVLYLSTPPQSSLGILRQRQYWSGREEKVPLPSASSGGSQVIWAFGDGHPDSLSVSSLYDTLLSLYDSITLPFITGNIGAGAALLHTPACQPTNLTWGL